MQYCKIMMHAYNEVRVLVPQDKVIMILIK